MLSFVRGILFHLADLKEYVLMHHTISHIALSYNNWILSSKEMEWYGFGFFLSIWVTLGGWGGPVSSGDNPQTAHLATRIKLFIVIKPMFEGEVMIYIVRSRSNAIFSERVWGRKPAWCKSSFSRRTKGTKVLFLKRLKSRGSWSNDLSLHIS